MTQRILTLNAGSSSLKFAIFEISENGGWFRSRRVSWPESAREAPSFIIEGHGIDGSLQVVARLERWQRMRTPSGS